MTQNQNNNLEEYERLGKIYPGIVAWGKMMHTKKIYITRQLQMAEEEKAPRDTTCLSRRLGKVSFKLFKDAVRPIRKQLEQLADDPDDVLKEGE